MRVVMAVPDNQGESAGAAMVLSLEEGGKREEGEGREQGDGS